MTNPTKTRRQFTALQKQEVVELCLAEGLTCRAGAQRLGLPNSTLAKWVRQARIDRGDIGATDQGQLTSDERAELNRLRKENRELKREKDFSSWRRRTLPGSSCRRKVLLGLPPFFCTGCTDGQMVDINGWLRNGCVRQHQDERFRANPTAPPRTSCSTPAAQSARFSGMGRKKLRSKMAAEKAAITPIKPTAFLSSLCLCLRSSGCSALLTSTPPVRSRNDLKSALGSLIQMLTRVSRWSSLTNWRVDPPSSRSLTSR